MRLSLLPTLALAAALCLPAAEGRSGETPDNANVRLRGSLANARIALERDGRGHVAFIGGSITEMEGYRPLVAE